MVLIGPKGYGKSRLLESSGKETLVTLTMGKRFKTTCPVKSGNLGCKQRQTQNLKFQRNTHIHETCVNEIFDEFLV